MTGGRRTLDIESALRWTFVDEIPKRGKASLRHGGGSNYDVVTDYGEHGTRIDEGLWEPGYPGELGDPHPDALTIERAVQSLAEITNAAYDESAGIADGLGFTDLDEAAALAWALPQMRGFVITCAVQNRRPEWRDLPAPGQVVAANGKATVLRTERQWTTTKWRRMLDEHGSVLEEVPEEEAACIVTVPAPQVGKNGGAPVYKAGAFCPLAWYPEPQAILLDRASYAVWWAALDLLAAELAGQLASIDVTGPVAAQRPWAGECDLAQPQRVLPDPYSAARLRQDRINALAARLFAHSRRRRSAA